MKYVNLLVARILERLDLETVFFKLFQIVVIMALARLGMIIFNKLVARIFKIRHLQGRLDERRANTLEALLRSMVRYVVYFIAAVTILQLFGVPVESVLTTAGIAGVAVAFGAQSLVRDVITGFFILMEDQFQVGDRVSIAGITGKVEEIGLRVTKVRDFGGGLHIIPNGKIENVTNYNSGPMLALVDVPIAYDNDLSVVNTLLRDCLAEYNRNHPELIEPASLLGIQGMTDAGIMLRILARTPSEQQWSAERELRQFIIERFNGAGIKPPAALCRKAGD